MKITFVNIITEHVTNQFNFIDRISDYLEIELLKKVYGKDCSQVIFGLGCNGPLSEAWINIETGVVSQMKYTRSKKMLALTVNLNYNEVKSANEDELIDIVKRGILKSYNEVKSLNIKYFDLDTFYNDLGILLSDREWLKHPEKYKKPPFIFKPKQPQQEIPEKLKMNLNDFWNLIQESIAESQGNLENQAYILISKLSTKNEEDIIGFEFTLRELIKRAYDYNVMGLLRIIDGIVTDDTLLYFRCRLILYGEELYYSVLWNPNTLIQKLDNNYQSELLLNVADQAFIDKYGKNTDRELPRDIANEYIDYNINNYQMNGIPWQEKIFNKRFAALLKLYKQEGN
jgi:hypothetical protein